MTVPQVVVPEMCPRCARGVPQVAVPEMCFVPQVCPRCAPGVPEIVPQVCPRCASADYRVTTEIFSARICF